MAKMVYPAPPVRAPSPPILWDEASTPASRAGERLASRPLNFDRAV